MFIRTWDDSREASCLNFDDPGPDTSATTKTTQACATTRTQSVDETSLKPLKAILEAIRELAD
jgi:hypothetical protein